MPFVKAILIVCGAFKSKETCLCERNEDKFTLNSYDIYPCSCFHFIVHEISHEKKIEKLLEMFDRGGNCVLRVARANKGIFLERMFSQECFLGCEGL